MSKQEKINNRARLIGLCQFPELIEKKYFMDDPKNGQAKYSANIWITSETAKKINDAAEKFATAKGLQIVSYIEDMKGNKIEVPGFESPVKDGTNNKFRPKDRDGNLLDEWTHIIYASSVYDIGLFDCRGTVKKLESDEEKNSVDWKGAEVAVDIAFFNKKGTNKVTAKLAKIGYRKQIISYYVDDNPFDSVEGDEEDDSFDTV